MRVSPLSTRTASFIWILLGVLWLANLPLRPLFDPDEGRYAEIPREMVAHGDWVTPTLNGLKYFEKPPLQYWATAALYSVFGVHTWTARLWAALLGFLCLPLVYLFMRRAGYPEETSLVGAALLAINPYFAIIGHLNLLDQGFCLFITVAVFSCVLSLSRPRPDRVSRNYMLLTWVCLALAVLSKGIVTLVLSGAAFGAYMLVRRDWRLPGRLHLALGVPLFLLITVPWFWLVQARNPEFASFFFVHEHFARYLTKEADRVEPWWYFLVLAFIAVLPVVWNFRHWGLLRGDRDSPAGAFRPELFLSIWCVVVLVFFSVSQSKLAPYVLPMMPPLAVLLARGTVEHRAALGRAAATLMALLASFVAGILVRSWRQTGGISHQAAAWAVVVLLLSALLVFVWRSRAAPARRWMALAAVFIFAIQALFLCYAAAFPARSSARLASLLETPLPAAMPLYAVGQYRPSLNFYLRRDLQVYDFSGELSFGMQQSGLVPEKLDGAEFLRRWRAESSALAIIEPSVYARLAAQGMPGQVIARDARSVVVSRS
jgi:4-amino-4-deoxy-L-arabinose transferase-like glycosyltransferase